MIVKELKEKLNQFKEIKLINDIIAESIIHGADSGGSYEQNEENLTVAVNKWLRFKGISDKYILKERVDVGDGWHVHQIVPIKHEF